MPKTKKAPTAPITITAEVVFKCLSCEAISEEAGPALYECSACGHVFNRDSGEGQGHQCPECHKFGAKTADESCSECQEGEVSEIQAIKCECHGEYHEVA